MNTHLNRHQLEQLVADDPRARIAPALRVHVGGCDVCGTRRRALEAARARFIDMYPPPEFAQAVVERASQPAPDTRPRWYARAAVGVLIATFVLLGLFGVTWLMLGRLPGLADLRPAEQPAAVEFHIFAQLGGGTHTLKNGDAAFADSITFEYTLDRPQYLLVLGIDDAGTVNKYFPGPGEQVAPLPAATRARLPIKLDGGGHDGQERIYALFSDALLEESTARAALTRAYVAADATGEGITAMGELDLPARQETLWFRRQ